MSKLAKTLNAVEKGASRLQIDSFFEHWIFPIIMIPAMIIGAAILNFFMIRSWMRGEPIGE